MSRLATRQSAIGTAVQVLPRLRQVLTQIAPTWHLRTLAALDAEFVARHDIGALIWDVDGTLTEHHADQLAPQCQSPFLALRQLPQLAHAILSNASEPRFRELSDIFPGVPICKGYLVDGVLTLRTRLGDRDSWSASTLAARLEQGAVPVRKPSGEVVRKLAAALDVPAHRVVMVGDQYLTDIAGANLAGIRSIKLPTFGRSHFPLLVQLSQRAEQVIYHLQHGRPVWEAPSAPSAGSEEGA